MGRPVGADAELVALVCKRGLVTAEGACGGYGVVCDADGNVDDAATTALRAQIRGERGEPPVFDKGPDIAVLLERCAEETGLPAPRTPISTQKALGA